MRLIGVVNFEQIGLKKLIEPIMVIEQIELEGFVGLVGFVELVESFEDDLRELNLLGDAANIDSVRISLFILYYIRFWVELVDLRCLKWLLTYGRNDVGAKNLWSTSQWIEFTHIKRRHGKFTKLPKIILTIRYD